MTNQEKYRVIGRQETGGRVVLTKNTTHEIAERIVTLMKSGSVFAELFIESDDDADAE